MSYDYMLIKGEATMDFESLVECAANQSIGATIDIKASLTDLYPDIRWEQSQVTAPDASAQSWQMWRALPTHPDQHDRAPELTLMSDADGQVRLLNMSRCERHAVARVAKALGLVALDEQTMELFGG